MGLFDLFKKRVAKDNSILSKGKTVSSDPDAQTVYFKNGKMYKVYPTDQESWYDARYLVSDGVQYDLENAQDIQNIPVPSFDKSDPMMEGYGVTGSLDYVIRMKAGSFYNHNEKELCSACLWKMAELMLASGMWQPKDYDRLVNWHNELGMFEEAARAKQYLQMHSLRPEIPLQNDILDIPPVQKAEFDRMANEVKTSIFKSQREFGNDLVAFYDYGNGCCEKCAAFRGRVYSISGKSQIYPALPRYAKQHGNFHSGCRCMMSTFRDKYDETLYYKGERVNALAASLRSWTDDRTPEEIEQYNTYIKNSVKREQQRIHQEEFSLRKGQNRLEFEAIQKAFPDKAPKSLTGYTRMKTMRSKNFLKLASLAQEKGIEINFYDE